MPWSRIGPFPGAYYRSHFACFRCRKMVRKPSPYIARPEDLKTSVSGLVCPECRQPLHNMGKAFRPPRQSAVKLWRKVEDQYRRGERWANGRW